MNAMANCSKINNFMPSFATSVKSLSQNNKLVVLNILTRKYSINRITSSILSDIVEECELSRFQVKKIIDQFFLNLEGFHYFREQNGFKWVSQFKGRFRKSRVLLHKIYSIAPIFNYRRARVNLKNLQKLISRKSCNPKIMTQLAIAIAITDTKDENIENKNRILKINIRYICSCSAYAYHRTIKVLGLDFLKGKVL